jgi:hypothetical protein
MDAVCYRKKEIYSIMKKEEAVLKLYDLGCSSEEIDTLIHIETLQRGNAKKARKKLAIAEIVKDMEL